MESRPPSRVVTDPVAPAGAARRPSRRRRVSGGYALVESTPDEPLAVLVAGPAGAARRAVIEALLTATGPVPRVPDGTFLVLGYGQSGAGSAYLPGEREPCGYPTHPAGGEPVLTRPPRRVELLLPHPDLRHFQLVDTPDVPALGVAGGTVLLDAVRRGGALLYVLPADRPLAAIDFNLLDQVGDTAAVFFAVTPPTAGRRAGAEDGSRSGAAGQRAGVETGGGVGPDALEVALAGHRAALTAALPGLADAPWFALDPTAADTAYLRGALMSWAAGESLRRAGSCPPVPPGATDTVPVVPDAARTGWADLLDRRVCASAQRIRQGIALGLANAHLRCVQEIVFAAGCPGLPALLDWELHAVSLWAGSECDAAVEQLLDEMITIVFGSVPEEGVRRRVAAAVGWGLADQRGARDLDRVLLVNAAAEVKTVTGLGAVAALDAYPGGGRRVVLPPIGAAVAADCYQRWRDPANQDPDQARSWLQRMVREIELELSREMTRRLRAVQSSLTGVLAEAVEHGMLMA